jgi:hypothetical protein
LIVIAQNYGDDFSDYVEFASENYGDGSLADSNNKNLGNTPAEIQRNQKLVEGRCCCLRRDVLFCCLGYLQLVLYPRLVYSPTQP